MDGGGKTVLMASPLVGEILPRIMAGALRAAASRHWRLHPVVCTRYASGALVFERSPGGGSLDDIFALLKPDGVIDILDALHADELRRASAAAQMRPGPAVVHLGEPVASNGAPDAYGDPESFARLALQELLRSGFEDYAYVPFLPEPAWSRARGSAFAKLVTVAGKRFHAFPSALRASRESNPSALIAPFLASLPKPCGIFAANDTMGEMVLNAADGAGMDVPGGIAVVSVDDIAHICDFTHPTLSSVRRDLEGEGRAAVELLADFMERPRLKIAPRAVPAESIVHRASTRFSALRDRRVARAQEFIRLHACESGFRPFLAVRETGLSRSAGDRLFKAVAGRSALQEMHAVRIARAKEKLRAGMQTDIVASECGYASTLDFRRVFRRVVGEPVGAWTRQALSASAKRAGPQ